MVSKAAIMGKEISLLVRAKAPNVMVTSWMRAIIAPRAYFNLRNQHKQATHKVLFIVL